MYKVVKEIEVDVFNKSSGVTIIAKQGDTNSRFLKITVTNNSTPMLINRDALVTINARRVDGDIRVFEGLVDESGIITVELNSWILELSGIVKCDISIIEDEFRLTSFDFFIDVCPSFGSSSEVSKSDKYDILSRLIKKVNSITNNQSCIVAGYYDELSKVFYEENTLKTEIKGAPNIIYIDLNTHSLYYYLERFGFYKASSSISNSTDEIIVVVGTIDEDTLEISVSNEDKQKIIDSISLVTNKPLYMRLEPMNLYLEHSYNGVFYSINSNSMLNVFTRSNNENEMTVESISFEFSTTSLFTDERVKSDYNECERHDILNYYGLSNYVTQRIDEKLGEFDSTDVEYITEEEFETIMREVGIYEW